jgi:hypothetical protein
MQVAPLVHDHQPSQLWNKHLDLITTNSMIFHISLIPSLIGHVTFHFEAIVPLQECGIPHVKCVFPNW